MHKHIPVHISQTVNFCPNFPLSGISDQKVPPPISENFRFEMTKVYSEIPAPPPFQKTSDLRWPKFTLKYPPPISENFRFEMTKVYSEIPPPFQKTSDLRWPKFTLKYPPPILENFSKIPPLLENFRFEMTKVYSEIPPPPTILENFRFEMTKSLLRNTPPFQKTSDLRWPKFTLKYPPFRKTSDLRWPKFSLKYPPPHFGKLQIWDDQKFTLKYPPPFQKASDLRWPKFTLKYPPPHFGKLQIWDDQSLLWNTPPFLENFSKIPPPFGKLQIWDDQKFTPKYPPTISENFRFEMTKVYSKIPPPPISENFRFEMTKVYSEIHPLHFGKLQIRDDQSLLRNPAPPPISENFRFEMTKVYSEIRMNEWNYVGIPVQLVVGCICCDINKAINNNFLEWPLCVTLMTSHTFITFSLQTTVSNIRVPHGRIELLACDLENDLVAWPSWSHTSQPVTEQRLRVICMKVFCCSSLQW